MKPALMVGSFDLPLLHRDDALVVVHKPCGIHTHTTGFSRREDSLLRWLRDQLDQHLYPLHRLDRASSGLVLFALAPNVASVLAASLRAGAFKKRYLAIVRGFVEVDQIVDRPLAELLEDGSRGREQEACTRLRCLQQVEIPFPSGAHSTTRLSLVEAFPETGRRHQIRRHLRGLNHPIVGDTRHGDRHLNRLLREHYDFHALALLAQGLSFPYPGGNEDLHIRTDLDPDWRSFFEQTAFDPNDPALDLGGNDLKLYPAFRKPLKRNWRHKARRAAEEALRGGSKAETKHTLAKKKRFELPAGRPLKQHCPLCAQASDFLVHHLGRCFYSCANCALLHQDVATRLDLPLEKERYLEHNNKMDDPSYRSYLQGVVDFILPELKTGAKGLDRGCGPAPLLSRLFEEAGFQQDYSDPIFFPDLGKEGAPYDFITLIEALEHAFQPLEDLQSLLKMLRPGGLFLVQTALLTEQREAKLEDWHYLRDTTHVSIFRPQTLDYLAKKLKLRLVKHEGDRSLFQKAEST
jgi:tRNA pseudouridine65 synthase